MTFYSEKIVYSLEDNWDEMVSITFVNGENYLSFNSLAYEDEIGIELNDQVNYISLLKSDFKFEISERFFRAVLEKTIIQNNFSDVDIIVHFQDLDFEKLKRGLNALIAQEST